MRRRLPVVPNPTVKSITCYFEDFNCTAPVEVQYAVYDDDGFNQPAELVKTTFTGTLTGDGWFTLQLTTQEQIEQGEIHWLLVNTHPLGTCFSLQLAWEPSGAGPRGWFTDGIPFGTWPETFTNTSTFQGFSIYANFTDQCTPVSGSCCLASSCIFVPQAVCEEAGGFFAGPGRKCVDLSVNCFTVGHACCRDDALCEVYNNSAACIAVGGNYLGDSVSCENSTCPIPTAPCCIGNSNDTELCILAPPVACTFNGNIPGPFGQDCSTFNCTSQAGHACCLGSGICITAASQLDCFVNYRGSFYAGDNVSCSQTNCSRMVGACCVNNTCVPDLWIPDCQVVNGTFYGTNTDCSTFNCSTEGGKNP